MNRTAVALIVLSLAVSDAAEAQDFGREWIDRVTHQLEQERGPLRTKPVEWSVSGGVAYQFDDNVYLQEEDEVDDSIIIPFARLSAAYADPQFEVEGDLLANYKIYADEDDLDDDEERLYLKMRQVGSRFSLGVEEIFQRVSSPLDVVFVDRAERIVSNTIGRVTYDITRQWILDISGNYQVVRFEGDEFDFLNNNLFRGEGSLVYRMPSGLDLVAQVGWMNIDYQYGATEGGFPDASGVYGRGGIRGDLLPRLKIQALAGWSRLKTEEFGPTDEVHRDGTVDAAFNLLYEMTETVRLHLDFTRQFTFGDVLSGEPFLIVNRVLALLAIEASPAITFRGRAQFDLLEAPETEVERTYISVGGSVEVRPAEWMILDAGVTFRTGEVEVDGTTVDGFDYDNLIIHAGVALTY